jgi:hypothetical protein
MDTMNPAYITAFAALAGSVIGGFTSFASTWLTQTKQARVGALTGDKKRRQKLYREFIDEASRLFAQALEHDKAQVADLVRIYAMINRMRLWSSPPVIDAAEKLVRLVIDTYLEPNKTFVELYDKLHSGAIDPLRKFSEACRRELETLGSAERRPGFGGRWMLTGWHRQILEPGQQPGGR